MCVGTENIEEAPNLRAHGKNTLVNNLRPYVFVLANQTTTLEHVLDKYSFKIINENYQQNKEDVKFAWIQLEPSDMRGKASKAFISTSKEIIEGQKEQDKPIVIVMHPAIIGK